MNIILILLIIIILLLLRQILIYKKLIKVDYLSGLLNKMQFECDISKKHFNRVSDTHSILILIDIDKFKLINDTFGHIEGDKILHNFGLMLQKTLRTTDKIYRIGGDEFAILTDTLIVVEKIQASTEVSISMGWSDIKYSDNAFNEADEMLYKNKRKKLDIYTRLVHT